MRNPPTGRLGLRGWGAFALGAVLLLSSVLVSRLRDVFTPFLGSVILTVLVLPLLLLILVVVSRSRLAERAKFFVALGVAFLLSLPVLCWTIIGTDYHLAKQFPLGDGRSLSVLEHQLADQVVRVCYSVRQDGGAGIKPVIIGVQGIRATATYDVVVTQQGNLVALVEKSRPEVVLAIHDFSTGKSWPFQDGSRDHSKADIGPDLLRALQAYYTSRVYRLASRTVPEMIGQP